MNEDYERVVHPEDCCRSLDEPRFVERRTEFRRETDQHAQALAHYLPMVLQLREERIQELHEEIEALREEVRELRGEANAAKRGILMPGRMKLWSISSEAEGGVVFEGWVSEVSEAGGSDD